MIREPLFSEVDSETGALSPSASALIQQRGNAASRRRGQVGRQHDRVSAPLSAGQQMVWLYSQLDPASSAYVRPMAMRLVGRLDHGVLQRALTEIVRRHEVLRSRVAIDGETATQTTFSVETIPLPVTDLSSLP